MLKRLRCECERTWRTAKKSTSKTPKQIFWSKVKRSLIFLKIEDDGAASLAHLLLAGFEDCCFFVSAVAAGCRLVVEQTTSGAAKNVDYSQFQSVNHCFSQNRPTPLWVLCIG
jgi:hypothetical protein